MQLERAVEEINSLPGRHLFFLDDNIFGDRGFAVALFREMRSMGRIWQGAATVRSVLDPELLNLGVQSGLRSLFIGFESLNQEEMSRHGKHHNQVTEYEHAVALLHNHGVMINGSFVFGMDGDDDSVFDTTTEWAITQGIETATFHILTPYPGTDLFKQYSKTGRIKHLNWDLYDTRHVVFKHLSMSAETLESGYWRSYEGFYRWSNIVRSSLSKHTILDILRHIAYVGAWKKVDPLWSFLISLRRLGVATPPLETVLRGKRGASNNLFQWNAETRAH
jgi:radical SAM superfamily enzyme YgiQ (UPF0313 family)